MDKPVDSFNKSRNIVENLVKQGKEGGIDFSYLRNTQNAKTPTQLTKDNNEYVGIFCACAVSHNLCGLEAAERKGPRLTREWATKRANVNLVHRCKMRASVYRLVLPEQ